VIVLIALFLASTAVEHYERANQLFQKQQFEQAGTELDAALKLDPDLVPALTLRGKLAMALNRFDAARPAFHRAAELAPENAYAQFMLGFFHYVDNDFREAVAPLERTIKLNPADTRALFYLALTMDGLARPVEAERYFRQALELETRAGKPSADTHVAYGRLLFSLGRYGDASGQIERALTLAPGSRDAWYEKGRLLLEAGDYAGAASAGEAALKLPPLGTTDRQVHFLLARAYRKLGRTAEAGAHLEKFKAAPATLRR
jgi:tetratricopeptide (TPR) repeat protein